MRLEFESLAKLRAHLATDRDLRGAAFQSLDLDAVADDLRGTDLGGNVLLGCRFSTETLALFPDPIVMPRFPNLPYDPYRSALYTPDELFAGYEPGDYETTLDGCIHRHFLDGGGAATGDVVTTLGRRLHDHAVSDALQEFIDGRKLVAIMGGHSLRRDDPVYLEVARLARDLADGGFLPVSGGGPGAMEATHLGAWFVGRPDEELLEAVGMLAEAPLYKPREAWLETALAVTSRFPLLDAERSASLAVPTWLYGHEPPTCFALQIAKYFANSVREEGLLAIATYGVVFAPGSAGTVQEIFQDACQNHYESFGPASPMILLGREYWTETKPVYPVLATLAAGQRYGDLLRLEDDREAILALLEAHRVERDASHPTG